MLRHRVQEDDEVIELSIVFYLKMFHRYQTASNIVCGGGRDDLQPKCAAHIALLP